MDSNPYPDYKHQHLRIITATSLFDGHDVSINIMRRLLIDRGVEVIHLGHNRSTQEIVNAAIEEDVQGIAVSSYQGGHVESFKYMIDLLKEKGSSHIKIFGGGGGVIIPAEIKELEGYGVTRIFTPEDGAHLGLQGIVNEIIEHMDFSTIGDHHFNLKELNTQNKHLTARFITAVEHAETTKNERLEALISQLRQNRSDAGSVVAGITGTGGAGKSSLTDELILRIRRHIKQLPTAVVCCDPSRRKTGGALLGDRIRMNAVQGPSIYMRSLATRQSQAEIPESLSDIVRVLKMAGYELILIETAGIGQGDSKIIDLADVSLYVMTSEFGAETQLEKIDMLDFADLVVINKYDKQGSKDALRDIRNRLMRNREVRDLPLEEMPVFGTIASKFNDDGVTALFHALFQTIQQKTGKNFDTGTAPQSIKVSGSKTILIPARRARYLSEIADTIRTYHSHTKNQADRLRQIWHLEETKKSLRNETPGAGPSQIPSEISEALENARSALSDDTVGLLEQWEKIKLEYSADDLTYTVRGQDIKLPLHIETLSLKKIPKVALPRFKDPGAIYQWLREENAPGLFPFTAGVFPLKREDEDPTRMFAGEGSPSRTNQRFKLLSAATPAKRLSVAFDPITLFGEDPDIRPDIYGKIGNSGVSICSLDDMKRLFNGFDLVDSRTSVSMTINGPAPIILAMFFNAAVDQQVEKITAETGTPPDNEQYQNLRADVLSKVRGTVQADILKEDQGQNSCIFSIEFALKMMGDIQEFFNDHNINNFYSVSISGYHIAEAGANPITQLALTLSNGFTYVEYYLSRGMPIDSFAPNLSFFFSSGMEPEYTVLGRVARRIWAITMREKYGGSERSQMLKYHTQTSGRSLHSMDIQFNDIRTTLQALSAIYDNCNSLHTNAYDEAITTPTRESVRRALAIQHIINREWGLAKNENAGQGSFIIETLTQLVEEAVLMEFDRIAERGGVIGAMETGYQRIKIQEESQEYEIQKHNGDYPIVGVNFFIDPDTESGSAKTVELTRASDKEKQSQIKRLAEFKKRNKDKAPAALERLQKTALSGNNIFEELMDTVRVCSLGQITQALYDVGGRFRRNM